MQNAWLKLSFSFFLVLTLLSSVALAQTGNVEINNFYAESVSTPLTEVDLQLFRCVDAACSSAQGAALIDASMGQNTQFTHQYLGTPNPTNYALFMQRTCYIPKAFNVEDFGSGITTTYQNVFNKVNDCRAITDSFSVTNGVRVFEPVFINFQAELEGNIASAFTQINQVTGFLGGNSHHYEAETLVTLNIYDENDNLLNTQSMTLNIFMDTIENAQFQWVPTQAGRYTAELVSEVTDCQCSSGTQQRATQTFDVFAAGDINYCFTLMDDLTINNPDPIAGDTIDIAITKVSTAKDEFGGLTPLPTTAVVELSQGNQIVQSETITLPANSNPFSVVNYTLNTAPVANAGNYILTVTGQAQNCPYPNDNRVESQSVAITVLDVPQQNRPPRFLPITSPIIVIIPNSVDQLIEVIDPDNDPLTITASNLPAGASFTNNRLTWTPTSNQLGDHTITFTVSDGQTSTQLQLTVRAITEQLCGNAAIDPGEQCDLGTQNNNVCTPAYGNSCSYCSSTCELIQIDGAFCGDGVVNGPETCDDGNNNNFDGCSATCAVENLQCTTDADCNNGLFCDGVETCFQGQCQQGTAPAVIDQVSCTIDFCDEVNDVVVNLPNHIICQDDLFCNGAEVCDPNVGCVAATTPACGQTQTCNEDAHACQDAGCGNGVVDAGEICDDGNLVNDDSCSNSCQANFCGDGVTQTPLGETCDDGNTNDNDGCTATCQAEFCGDNILQQSNGEQCDDGNNVDGDGCSVFCQIEIPIACGNGIIEPSNGEQCDDSNFINGDGCSATCLLEICGNNVVDVGETCDDGNTITGDGCSNFCVAEATCGNAIIETPETCDDGNTANGDGCSATCQIEAGPVCGNGVTESGETCDDGNTNSNDGCSSTCQLELCGNGVADPGEACDDGNQVSGDGCSATCQFEVGVCGNGVTEVGEQCDDNNQVDGDGCSSTCQVEGSFCGNNVVETGETCDDGNQVSGDGCSNICQAEVCGDGVQQGSLGETCDDGNTAAGDGCSATCQTEFCGDGVLQTGLGETCDDGNNFPNDGCSAMCQIEATCGNAIIEAPETCDDGNVASGDGCSNICQAEFCGDGITQPALGEQCDDGNTNNNDGCSATCQFEVAPNCGNGMIDAGETCDDGNTVDNDGCSSVCQVEFCGDAITQPGEQCDDGNSNDFDACSNVCIINVCGDGTTQPGIGETCDDGNTITGDGCSAICQIETNTCGNGIIEVPEACDDGNTVAGDGCSSVCQIETCTQDSDCDNGLFCDGTETCNLATNVCQAGAPIVCTTGFVCSETTMVCEFAGFRVDIQSNKISAIAPFTANFESELLGGVAPYFFAWDLDGDGTVDSTATNPFREYRISGTFRVALTVTDALGNIAQDTLVISANEDNDPKNIVHIGQFNANSYFTRAGEELSMRLSIQNTANKDLRDTRIAMMIPELGVRSPIKNLRSFNRGQQVDLDFPMEMPASVLPGEYYVMVMVDIDGDRRIKYRPFTVYDDSYYPPGLY